MTLRRASARGRHQWEASPAATRSGLLSLIITGFLLLAAVVYPVPSEVDSWFWIPAIFAGMAVLVGHNRPKVALGVSAVSSVAYALAVPETGAIFVTIAATLYQIVAFGLRVAPVRIGIAGACIVLGTIGIQAWEYNSDEWQQASVLIYVVAIPLLGTGWGAATRELRLRNAELERLRHLELHTAVVDERRRIAGDVHDVVGHHLVAISVRARTLSASETSGSKTQAGLRAIADTASAALTSMRGVVTLLRVPDQPGPWFPESGLGQLPELLESLRATGLPVDYERTPSSRETTILPLDVDLAAFRIIQESLTNVLRHASATRALVRLDVTPTMVRLAVHDNGHDDGHDDGHGQGHDHGRDAPSTSDPNPPPGQGLIGMRERAAGVGGALTVGRSHLGGWLVSATLPATTSGTSVPG
jgi:signal transduction histidine kinase